MCIRDSFIPIQTEEQRHKLSIKKLNLVVSALYNVMCKLKYPAVPADNSIKQNINHHLSRDFI